jgi:hypothetical protein
LGVGREAEDVWVLEGGDGAGEGLEGLDSRIVVREEVGDVAALQVDMRLTYWELVKFHI